MEFPTELFKHITYSTKIPEGYNYAFDISIFHTKDHLILQGDLFYSYFILHNKKKSVVGHVHFHIQDKMAFSPLKASFGGIECKTTLDARIIWSFIDYIEDQLSSLDISSIQMTFPSLYYNLTAYSKIFDVLNKKDYQIFKWETGACLTVSEKPFQDLIKYNEKKRFNRGKKLSYKEYKPALSKLPFIYDFIARSRKEKKQHISMGLDQLKVTVNEFPENFHLFAVNDEDKTIAASISILIKPGILYNFYQAHDADYDKHSPVLLLSDYMYRFCKENNITTLDFGTSALEDKPNFLLLHFKERIGTVLSPKFGFSKKLL
ncbi:MAG: GNAT family N-acetyltransferase [Candidatus Cyclobacteriaceae bacterium M2_1C_046]